MIKKIIIISILTIICISSVGCGKSNTGTPTATGDVNQIYYVNDSDGIISSGGNTNDNIGFNDSSENVDSGIVIN